MVPSSVIRSTAIAFAITIAIIGPHASGFTIDRSNKDTVLSLHAQSADLSSGGSDRVKEESKIEVNKKNEDSDKSTKTDNFKTETTAEMPEVKSNKTLSIQQKQTTTTIRTTTENTKIPTISSDTVEVFDSIEDVTELKNAKFNGDPSVKPREPEPISEVTEHEKNIPPTKISREATLPVELSTVTDQIATDSESEEHSTQNDLALSVLDKDAKDTFISDMSETSTNVMETPITPTVSLVENTENNTSIDPTTDSSLTISDTSFLSTATSENADAPTDMSSTYSEFKMTDTTAASNNKMTEPSWRKYTTIIRKRVTSSEDTSQTSKIENETMRAETSNMNIEKAFNVTPMPSLQKFDLLSNTKKPSSSEMLSDESAKTTVTIKSTIMYPNALENSEAHKIGTVQSKRAGYLNHSENTFTTVSIASEKEVSGTQFETTGDVTEITEVPDFKKVSSSESHSQLAEDAIQEELMKEEALSNHQENINRYHDENPFTEGVKLEDDAATSSVTLTSSPRIDALSVQPISHERSKTTLYTISPNYKPLKKIDVQAAKPFVRDPDDNSWRNESISSLGIVFKPKNSTVSFKEVLKNKTQTELNNLQEKYAKDDLPDLRVRLEKIAEVRKTKKKKMNKDGEEVYTDYEEDKSAETTSNATLESIFSGLSSAELFKHISTPPSTQINMTDLTSPMSTLTQLEANKEKTMTSQAIFKSLGLDSLDYLTTAKPKKFFNIAEYYDTTDEYDADYVTMTKLDLKKFTPPVRTSPPPPKEPHHIEPLLNMPMKSYFPDRKPTVQYFPPREPQKVNVNNIDRNFERKINLFEEHSKIEPQPPFVTVPSLPIATEKPTPEMRPDLPSDIRTYMRPDMRPDFRLGNDRPDIPPNIRLTEKHTDLYMHTPADPSRNYYMTNAPRTTEPHDAYVIHEGSLNRGSYVIKHYKDLLNAAAVKDIEDDRPDYMPLTESPRETTASEMDSTSKSVDYDYDSQFRKDVLNRFVDNFNQNSERFKVDFPILYNSSVVHRPADEHGRVMASSRAFLKRLYEGTATKSNAVLKKPCEPNCDMTVELSPAYELHYYVPEQEEKEEIEPRRVAPLSPPYRHTL